jgi:replicative DNA helicase
MNADREWAEAAILSRIFEAPESYKQFDLTADHFRVSTYRKIYQAIGHHVDHGFPVDVIAIGQTLEGQGHESAKDLLGELVMTPTAAAESHAEGIKWSSEAEIAKGIARDLIRDGDIATAVQRLHSLTTGRARYIHRDDELRRQFFANLATGKSPGLLTGFRRIDEVLGGFHPSDLIVINLATNLNQPFLFVSGEQPAIECEARILSAAAMVPATDIRNRKLTNDQHRKLADAASREVAPYWIYDRSAPSLAEVWSQARRAQHEIGAKCVFVDYIQRMKRDPKKPKHEAVGDNIMGLKELARDLEVPVVVLAQVNRQVDARPAEDRLPGISDLKDSGEIEQEADVVITMYRKRAYEPADYDHSAVLNVCKNRHGPTGLVNIEFLEQFVKFQDGGAYGF